MTVYVNFEQEREPVTFLAGLRDDASSGSAVGRTLAQAEKAARDSRRIRVRVCKRVRVIHDGRVYAHPDEFHMHDDNKFSTWLRAGWIERIEE